MNKHKERFSNSEKLGLSSPQETVRTIENALISQFFHEYPLCSKAH